jgi:prepilin-type N-terminal cleavage/methylation domain-containing protein
MQVSERGFSLVELLIVTALMGIVVMAVHALYTHTHRTARSSEEIVEVQQNLRVAMDRIARDIRMAGFLTPPDTPPISVAEIDTVTIHTVLASGKYARVTGVCWEDSTSAAFFVASAEMVDLFDSGAAGDHVRILRPGKGEILEGVLQVNSRNRNERRLTLKGFSAQADYLPGDVIVRVSGHNTDPVQTITYRLIDDPGAGDRSIRTLVRETDGAPAEIAGKIADLHLEYLAAPCGDISAVRVILTGATADARKGSEGTIRRLESVIRLRNR